MLKSKGVNSFPPVFQVLVCCEDNNPHNEKNNNKKTHLQNSHETKNSISQSLDWQ